MDRLGVLIDRLQFQYQQQVPSAQLLVTIQMIQQEIAGVNIPEPIASGRAVVTMPTNFSRITLDNESTSVKERNGNKSTILEAAIESELSIPTASSIDSITSAKPINAAAAGTTSSNVDSNTNPPIIPATEFDSDKQVTLEQDEEGASNAKPISQNTEDTPKVIYEILNAEELYGNLDKDTGTDTTTDSTPPLTDESATVSTELKRAKEPTIAAAPTTSDPSEAVTNNATTNLPYNPLLEVPTLSHQKDVAELNDLMAHHHKESFNEKLRPYQTELGMVLTDSPVKDLKKAIGINDRFLFISELFRGDETMYERSLKTINNFHIFPEAEYWMERELKIKLGWNENQATVKQFYQLVKRRFTSK